MGSACYAGPWLGAHLMSLQYLKGCEDLIHYSFSVYSILSNNFTETSAFFTGIIRNHHLLVQYNDTGKKKILQGFLSEFPISKLSLGL